MRDIATLWSQDENKLKEKQKKGMGDVFLVALGLVTVRVAMLTMIMTVDDQEKPKILSRKLIVLSEVTTHQMIARGEDGRRGEILRDSIGAEIWNNYTRRQR
ncbi:hypothetical protein PIB30_004674 [Stylosanthes scabra]|uniref:Uncharacterized protein n=1 Tax=Stylosanthes scabra TaxID=79078 RepID=A0ABU6Q3Q5_9FABA|nr:hypothetical protein [Stylosanthes scabra]